VNHADTHCHGPDTFSVRRGLVLKRIQEQVEANPTEPVRRVYDEVITIDSGDSDDLPAFQSVRSRAKRFRSKFMPPIPGSIDDVAINGEWCKTWKGRSFLSFIDNNLGVAVFTTKKLLRSLQKADFWYLDGTFRTAPLPYKQFLTIQGYLNGFVVPMVFVLLPGKLSVLYRRVLQHIKQRIWQITGSQVAPNKIVCDFEKSLHIAIQFEFPRTKIMGCYYHFCQSLWRRVQGVGLAGSYIRDRKLKQFIRRIMAIAVIPTLLVMQNFQLLCSGRRFDRLIVHYPNLQQWVNYVDRIYVGRNANFPPASWNVYDRNSDTRTNNHLEGQLLSITFKTLT
jgi:hypothetical protein